MGEEKKYAPTIEISRPTGPRVLPPIESRGYLSKVKQRAVAVTSVLRRPKTIAVGSSLALAVVAHLAVSSLTHGFSSLYAQASILLTGAGAVQPPAGGSYTGPGDVFATSPYAAYSCAQAFTAAYATALGSACDVVDTSTGLITCTYHFQSNGKVNPSECNGGGQSCQTSCSVTKAYDQTGNGRDVVNTTLATMPVLTFNSTPTGTLPAINCGAGATGFVLATAGTVTQAQPFTMSVVMIRNSGTAQGGALGSNSGVLIGSGAGANLALIGSGSLVTAAATDSTWFALQTLHSGAASAINVNGSDTTVSAGINAFSSNNIRICRANVNQLGGLVAEAIIWAATSTSTVRGNINTNQHSAGRYNF